MRTTSRLTGNMSFITSCPHCETSFKTTESQIQKAQGIVRCGFCLGTFSALEHQLYLDDEIDLGELDLNQAPADSEFSEFLHEETTADPGTISAEDEMEAADHQVGEYSARIPTLAAANEVFEEIDEQDVNEEWTDEELALSSDSDSAHSTEGVTEETGEEETTWSGLADETDDGTAELIRDDESDDGNGYDALSETVTAAETVDSNSGGTTSAAWKNNDEDTDKYPTAAHEEAEDTADTEDIEAIGSAFVDDRAQEDFGGTDHADRLEDDEPEDEEAETLYTTEPAESDSEEEYSLLDSPPPPDPLPASPSLRSTARQKHELQILASLYDDSPLERLDDDNLDSLADEPIAIHQHRQRSRLVTSLLITANAFLLFGLGAQFLWQHIDRLLLDERFRPLTAPLCQTVTCPEVTQFDINQFRTEELIVNAHPQIENALQIDFIFRNNAEYPQAFPRVELNFTDINRRLLANRLFEPEEYLDPELQQFDLLPAGASVQIKLEIADPGPAAINYTLALRSPAQP